MGIETWSDFPRSLKHYVAQGTPLPCSDQNPRLKCPETRWARDYCLAVGGSCEYKIEAHWNCLEDAGYPKDRVDILRKNFRPGVLDYPTSAQYLGSLRGFYGYHAYSGVQRSGGSSFTGIQHPSGGLY